jgi:hypothetical protein
MLRGIPLPVPGSFEYNVMAEGIRREREEKIALARLFALLFRDAHGLDGEKVGLLLSEYVEELYQYKYNYKYVPIRQRFGNKKINEELEDVRILKKVAAMTVTEPFSARDN